MREFMTHCCANAQCPLNVTQTCHYKLPLYILFSIKACSHSSHSLPLYCGVPQCSILGSLLSFHSVYLLIIKPSNADDIQLFIFFSPKLFFHPAHVATYCDNPDLFKRCHPTSSSSTLPKQNSS